MPKCQLGMQKNVQGHRIASVCKQTYDASCTDSEEEPLLCKSFPSTATGTLDVFLAMLPYAYASGHHG